MTVISVIVGSIRQGVAGLAGNAELAAHLAHAFAIEKAGDKA